MASPSSNLLQPRGAFARLHDWLTAPKPDQPEPAPRRALEERRVDPNNIGRGFADPRQGGMKRIVVTVEPAMFERIHAVATAEEISMAAAVRRLIDTGLPAARTEA